MPPVFGRLSAVPHPYEPVLQSWLGSRFVGHRAMARNIMHDHRVSTAREASFDKLLEHPCSDRGLQNAIVDYFKAKVRTRTLPDYVYSRLNGQNLLTGTPSGKHVLHKDLQLVRLLDLNGLGRMFRWAKDEKGVRQFERCPGIGDDPAQARWLDEELQGQTEARQRAFVAAVLDVLNEYRRERPFQPTWASTWAAFGSHAMAGPERWLQVFGMPRPTYPRWVVLLRYTVREAGTVARPTQLDAGWFPYHFPSPSQAPPAGGGHPMDLRLTPRATTLLPEYVHRQIDHLSSHVEGIGRTAGAVTGRLGNQRQAHHELLASRYGPDVRAWMASSI